MGYVYARKGQVDVEYTTTIVAGLPTAGTYATVGCLSGDLVIPRSKSPGSTELDNWCVSQQGGVQQVELGALVIEPTFTVEMDLDSAAFAALNTAFSGRADVALRVTATDGTNTIVFEYVGKITNHDLQYRGGAGATSQVNFTYHVNSIVSR